MPTTVYQTAGGVGAEAGAPRTKVAATESSTSFAKKPTAKRTTQQKQQMSEGPACPVDIVLLGSFACGKTTLLECYWEQILAATSTTVSSKNTVSQSHPPSLSATEPASDPDSSSKAARASEHSGREERLRALVSPTAGAAYRCKRLHLASRSRRTAHSPTSARSYPPPSPAKRALPASPADQTSTNASTASSSPPPLVSFPSDSAALKRSSASSADPDPRDSSAPTHLLHLKCWDTSGHLAYRFLLPMYYKTARAALVMFSLHPLEIEESFERAQQLIRELKEQDALRVIMLVGTKSDSLHTDDDATDVSKLTSIRENAASFASFHDIPYRETSAYHNIGVATVFERLANAVRAEIAQQLGVNGPALLRHRVSDVDMSRIVAQCSTHSGSVTTTSGWAPIDNGDMASSWTAGSMLGRLSSSDPPLTLLHAAAVDGGGPQTFALPPIGSPTPATPPPSRRRGHDGVFNLNDPQLGSPEYNKPVAGVGTVTSPPPRWAKDSSVTECAQCEAVFTVFNRKHHCRHCGLIFCSVCSSQSCAIPKFGMEKPVRVCDRCYALLTA
eukprot:CAMPEP_0177682020 /NCGR_PEP_ID=MMETSP0447-20121125/31034_1 /TAXON_ID=0 /ORGANISM="Stygamoeba regulata, Strain BSH-02190019" /LENGTH=559 /DNA_ID=CAMNT_0019191491 /DNA_START=142 /DNA_END=1821 /DNA_ORIENTATION=+